MRDLEQETREELLRYLEQVSGHALRTRKDVDDYIAFLEEVHPPKLRPTWVHNLLLSAKHIVLAALMAFAAFQYFAVDAVTEVLSVDKVKFLTPPPLPNTART